MRRVHAGVKLAVAVVLASAGCAETYDGPTSELDDTAALPESLTASSIRAGLEPVKAPALRCAQPSSAGSLVKVHVKVTPDGRVDSVDVVATRDPAVGACVASAVRQAQFDRTQRGGGFVIPFAF